MSLQWKYGMESRRDGAGSIFGENVLEGHPTKGETAIAYEDCEFLTLEKADYKACVHQTLVEKRKERSDLLKKVLPCISNNSV